MTVRGPVSNSHTVRIPRGSGRPTVRVPVGSTPSPGARTAPAAPIPFRPNLAGLQRALRLSLIYLAGLVLVFLAFVAIDLSVPGHTGAGATFDLLLFGLVALGFAVAGTVIALHPVPRLVGVTPNAIVIVGRWGRRAEWSPRDQVRVRVVRRFPAGFFSHEAVESVELAAPGRPSRNYVVAEGLFPADPVRG